MIDFIAIDFETASRYMNSACSVGISVVCNLKIVDSFYATIQPPDLYLDQDNIRIHGITPEMVKDAPTLDSLWPQIAHFFSPHTPVVAHNVHFDLSVLRQSTTANIPSFPYLDSMDIAAPLVGGRKSLSACAEILQIELKEHHNALADANACAHIAICALKAANCLTMWEYLARFPRTIRDFCKLKPQTIITTKKKKVPQKAIAPSEVHATVDFINPQAPFYGKVIVFTGELSFDRRAAMQMAVNAGATVRSAVSRKTDYLVVGVQDKAIVGEDGLSTKEEQAYKLINEGKAAIQIIHEAEFLALARGEVVV